MEDVKFLMKHASFQRRSQFAHHHLMPGDPRIEWMQALHAPWSLSATPPLDYKTPHKRPWVRTHSSEGISPLWPPLPGKAIKLFFFTSPITLSPRINSVSGHRGQIRLHYCTLNRLQSSINITSIHIGKPKKFHVTLFIAIFSLWQWSGTEPTISEVCL